MNALPFNVVPGSGGFKVLDEEGIVYASALVEDEAALYCARLNWKFHMRAALIQAAEHLGECAIISCKFCETCRGIVAAAKSVAANKTIIEVSE